MGYAYAWSIGISIGYEVEIVKRRQFLRVGIQSVSLLSLAYPGFAVVAATQVVPATTLTAFIDTLIPQDETPAASQLGLASKLLQHAAQIENYTGLLVLGCQWLDTQAKALAQLPFASLAEDQRVQLVALAEASPAGTIARQLFDHVRADLFEFYYTHPAVWPSLGLHGAPQPVGYLDYVMPPAKKPAQKTL
jgi:hypothetical protein